MAPLGMVHVDRCVFERNDSGSVSTGILLNLKEGPFPGYGWDDSAAGTLHASSETLLRLLQGTSRVEQVHFIEGPLHVELETLDPTRLKILAIKEGGKNRPSSVRKLST